MEVRHVAPGNENTVATTCLSGFPSSLPPSPSGRHTSNASSPRLHLLTKPPRKKRRTRAQNQIPSSA